jgi:hypothetical protein
VLRSHRTGQDLCDVDDLEDPLAGRDQVHMRDLADRQWFQLPEGADPIWRAYWGKCRASSARASSSSLTSALAKFSAR